MSFRIDDILKRGSSTPPKCSTYEPYSPTGCDYKPLNLERSAQDSDSILQQTLLNRTSHHPYSRSLSDPYDTSKYYDSLYNSVKYYTYSSSYPDPYLEKAHHYSNMYPRSRVWPMYPLSLPVSSVLAYPYGHYSKRKGGQVRFTATQTDALEKRFVSHKYLSPEDRKILANSLKLTDRQVKTWFQNRRAKWRRCNSVSSNNTPSENQDDSGSEDLSEISDQKQPTLINSST